MKLNVKDCKRKSIARHDPLIKQIIEERQLKELFNIAKHEQRQLKSLALAALAELNQSNVKPKN